MNSRVILAIEDAPDFRLALVFTLRSEGFRVYSAKNGHEGLQVLKEISRPCLIFLDYFMPL
jgi:CheY-like chemotaxis protein